MAGNSGRGSIRIKINTSRPAHVTEKEFLSLGMDSNLIRNRWETWDFNSRRLRTLSAGLAPAYLRLMGTDGDHMSFTREVKKDEPTVYTPSPGPPFPSSEFTMSARDWDRINTFAADVGWRIMFGFNAQLRHGEQWNADNAKDILSYSVEKGYAANLDFELGNEPDLFFVHDNMVGISGQQMAKDYKQLRTILDTDFKTHFRSSKLCGPGIATVNKYSLSFLSEFLAHLEKGIIDVITWHQYYGGSELNQLKDYTDTDILDRYVNGSSKIISEVKRSQHADLDVWQGETASTYAPSGSILEMSYVAGFMLLDKLGVSARFGMKVVVRQTFYGFWFALVNEKLNPVPNYWVSLLYRRLVGSRVLDVTEGLTKSATVRIYANFVDSTSHYNKDAVVIYALNLGKSDVSLDLSSVGSQVYEYLFTPGDAEDLVSTKIKLNDRLISMPDDSNLPDLVGFGRVIKSSKDVLLPASRFAFYVINDAVANASKI